MSKRSLAARRKRSASHRRDGHHSWIFPGFAGSTPASREVGGPAAPAPQDAPIHPLEYSGRSYAAPLTSLDALPQPELDYDGWHETGAAFSQRRYPREGFSWRERDWNLDGWKRRLRRIPALVAAVLIVLASLVLGFAVATRAARGLQVGLPSAQPTSTGTGVVIQPVPAHFTPTPTDAAADIGVWVSDSSPSAGGSIKVFVRLTIGLKPDAHVPVTLYVQTANSSGSLAPVATDGYGIATFTLNLAGLPPHQPVFISASAIVGGQTLSAETSIVPG